MLAAFSHGCELAPGRGTARWQLAPTNPEHRQAPPPPLAPQLPPPQQQANNSSQLQATSGSSAEAPATQPVAQDPIHPQQGSRGALMKFGKVIPIQSPRTEMPPAYKTRRPPPTPHGSPATDPPRLSSTACRGKISAKRDNSRYQPLTSLAAEVPGQHHQKHRKSKPNHPSSQPSGHQLGR